MQKETILNIGFDDTDSLKGMCTTYLAYNLVDSLKKENVQFLDYPRLIRFNPNIPWKTRGNGAVALKIKTNKPDMVKNRVIEFVKKFSDTKNGANPGVVFCENTLLTEEFTKFSKRALWQLISRKHAKKFVSDHNLESFYIGNGQGLIGAIGAIGYNFSDYTYELLSYRKKSKFGKKRILVTDNVRQMQEKTYPRTFNSYDTKNHKVLFAPHSPDPVFFGIRGEDAKSLLTASKLIKTLEKPVGHMIFKSNQGTGDHLQNEIDVLSLKPYCSGIIIGVISIAPKMDKGGHVMFAIKKDGIEIKCAVYKETGITKNAMGLIVGDKLCVGGGIRKASSKYERVLNLEFFKVLRLERQQILVNPMCIQCKKHMKSKGHDQGFECIKCGRKSDKKVIKQIPRQIKKQIYVPQVSAHRHLTRPQQRLGVTNKESQFNNSIPWFHNYNN